MQDDHANEFMMLYDDVQCIYTFIVDVLALELKLLLQWFLFCVIPSLSCFPMTMIYVFIYCGRDKLLCGMWLKPHKVMPLHATCLLTILKHK